MNIAIMAMKRSSKNLAGPAMAISQNLSLNGYMAGKTNRIAELRKAKGLSQEALGDLVSAHWITVSKLERGKMKLTQDWMNRIAPALGVKPIDLIASQEPDLSIVTPQPAPSNTVEELPAGDAFTFAKVDGSVQAGAFLAVEALDDLGEVISAPRDRRFPFARQVAYRVKGDSMDQARPKPMDDGDYIVCAIWEDLALKEKDGLNVVVQQTTADGQLRERSVKELRVFPDRVEFHPRSSNPAYKPIVVNREYHTDDGKEVTILALVRWVFDNQELPV